MKNVKEKIYHKLINNKLRYNSKSIIRYGKNSNKNLGNISGDKFVYDKINSELTIFDNVKYVDKDKKIIIESQKLIYNESNITIL